MSVDPDHINIFKSQVKEGTQIEKNIKKKNQRWINYFQIKGNDLTRSKILWDIITYWI